MNPLIPYIDSKNLDRNGTCYTFFDDFILVYHSDDSVTPYKIINDKIYLSSSSSSFPSQDSGGDNPPCEPIDCDNLFDSSLLNGLSCKGISYFYNSVTGSLTTSGTFDQWGSPISLETSVVLQKGITYYISINKPLSQRLYFYKGSASGATEWINVGDTFISFTSNVDGPLFIQVRDAVEDLRIMITTDEENQTFCKFGSGTDCSDTPSDDSSSSSTCYSYDDIIHIPHSMSGLSPFYCFLCVVIFLTLLYVPYKIFIRPFFKAKL